MGAAAKSVLEERERSQKQEFALWSGNYDDLPNPLLALEERFLSPVLSDLEGRNALDVGCGTGRWLRRLLECNPASLTGVDFCPEMVAQARRKLAHRATVAVGDATCLPVPSCSQDVVIVSFVASYVPSIDELARELRRVCRTDSRLYISDIHPETAAACHWKRGSRVGRRSARPASYDRSLSAIVQSLHSVGFNVTCLLEPPFEATELEIFRAAGKLDAFHAAAELPAIYILQATAEQASPTQDDLSSRRAPEISLLGARLALASDATVTSDIGIADKCIATIGSSARWHNGRFKSVSVHLNGYLLLPGLINAHDHLEFGLYPNLGRGPYLNSLGWAGDIHKHDRQVIAAQQSIPRDVRLWWGALRNLLCGVTTVSHHNPLDPELLKPDFPIRVITKYGWAHSLAMDSQWREKFSATRDDAPFVIHAGEGIDRASADEIFELERLAALDERTVLVHGVALNPDGIALVNARGAALVWCPSSNRHLFGRTHNRKTIAKVQRALLGTDSPLTAAGDLLDEIRIAHGDISLPARDVYRMVFETAPRVFRLQEGQGSIRPGAVGDVIAVRDKGLSPAATLAGLSAGDVELVLVAGRVQLASEDIYRRLPSGLSEGLRPLWFQSHLRWVRAPLGRLFREAHKALGCEIRIGGKRVTHVCSTWL